MGILKHIRISLNNPQAAVISYSLNRYGNSTSFFIGLFAGQYFSLAAHHPKYDLKLPATVSQQSQPRPSSFFSATVEGCWKKSQDTYSFDTPCKLCHFLVDLHPIRSESKVIADLTKFRWSKTTWMKICDVKVIPFIMQ